MRVRLLLAALATVLAAAAPAPANAASSLRLDGSATIHFGGYKGGSADAPHPGLSNAPCEPNSFCGPGRFRDLGLAVVFLDGDSYGDEVSPDCVSYDKDEAVVAPDESWGVILHSTGTACFPSGSSNAPPGTSFGNPGVYRTSFTVVEGWGRFAGATGSGTEVFRSAGDRGSWTFGGTLTPAG
jgi:hypothetical protein